MLSFKKKVKFLKRKVHSKGFCMEKWKYNLTKLKKDLEKLSLIKLSSKEHAKSYIINLHKYFSTKKPEAFSIYYKVWKSVNKKLTKII